MLLLSGILKTTPLSSFYKKIYTITYYPVVDQGRLARCGLLYGHHATMVHLGYTLPVSHVGFIIHSFNFKLMTILNFSISFEP